MTLSDQILALYDQIHTVHGAEHDPKPVRQPLNMVKAGISKVSSEPDSPGDQPTSPDDSPVYIDYETEEFNKSKRVFPHNARMLGMSYAAADMKTKYITDKIPETLQSFGNRPRVYHNACFDRAVEMREGLPLAESFDDTMVMARLLDETQSCKLKDLGTVMLGQTVTLYKDVDKDDPQQFAKYAEQDADLTMGLCADVDFPGDIKKEGLAEVYQIELDVIDPTIVMIHNGIEVNIKLLKKLKTEYECKVPVIQQRIDKIAGYEVNIKSIPQLQTLLFEEMGFPVTHKTKKRQPSTNKIALNQLATLGIDDNGLVKLIQDHRKYTGLVKMALKVITFADPVTSRVHCQLNPLIAPTGRFSCSEPPLQAIPEDMLDAFVASDGNMLIEADFSQIELRVLAHYTKDPAFLTAYGDTKHQIDIHRKTAALALGIPESDVTDEQRRDIGKSVNFGIVYGQTKYGLADKLGISLDEAQAFIDGFLRGYPQVKKWIELVERKVQRLSKVRTLYGRRRHLPHASSFNRGKKAHALRQAVNTIIQGTAADINKMALSRLYKALPDDCHMLLTVHDSVLLEVPKQQVKKVVPLIRRVMEEQPPKFTVPIVVDIKAGQSWGACKRSKAIV